MTNHKTLIIAGSEFTTRTRSKAFLIGVAMMPILMGVAFGAQRLTRDTSDRGDHRVAVVDRTGVLYDAVQAVAGEWNRRLAADPSSPAGRFLIERAAFAPDDQAARARLSDRVRRGDLYAFVEIPADAIDPAKRPHISYFSNHAADRTVPTWIGQTVNAAIIAQRFRSARVDAAAVTNLMRQAPVEQFGLVERSAGGRFKDSGGVDPIRTQIVPVAMMMIVLFSVMSTAPQLLNSTIEEKMSRVSEVLIGSVTPFELMMGKLLGTGAVSMLIGALYVAGGVAIARHLGYGDAVIPIYLVWLFLFLALAILMFGAVFVAIGAACTDLKDTQAMMPPAMLVMMLPFMVWVPVVRAPESGMALALSLWPTAAPFLMLLRVAIPPGPPAWQVALSFALTGAAAVFAVYAAGRIFRTGILMQGKAPTFTEMWRWVRA
ncbi:MAG: ABC transporter permease [Vicinamibacterales bacterium]